MIAEQLNPKDARVAEALALIRSAFFDMAGRIDPPSSMHLMTLESLCEDARSKELWGIGNPLRACVLLTPRPDRLYIGKLAVAETFRGQGLARDLVVLAGTRAKDMGLACLELETRVELTENHDIFRKLGFEEVARTAHPGFDHPTSITFRKVL